MASLLEQDRVFLKVAKDLAELSQCAKTQVGAIIVLDGRILSTGVNGSPSGYYNCNQVHTGDFDHVAHRAWADNFEVHAETNSVVFSAKHGVKINGATLYCTMQPCKECSKNLINAGIKRVVYSSYYDRVSEEEREKINHFLETCGVVVEYKPLID